MALFWLKKAILAKIESAYGTDPVPTGAANAILARNVTITPLELEMNARDVALPYFGSLADVPGSAQVKIEFECEMASAGAAGTAPAYGPLLRACGLSETINAGVSVVYAPISAAFEAVSIYFNVDGVRHVITGCRGNVSGDLSNNAIPVYKFSFTGIYNAPTDVSLPTLTLTAWKVPLPVNKVNTTPASLHGYAGVMANLTFDLGNAVSFRPYINAAEEVRLSGRKVVGSVAMEAGTVAAKDWFGIAKAGTTGVLTLTHGTVAGSKVKIDAPAVQLIAPKYEDSDGITMISMDLMMATVSGNDEITITVL